MNQFDAVEDPQVTGAAAATDLVVLQLNILRGASKISNGLERVADIIEQTQADIALLAEADNGACLTIQQILAGRGGEWYAAGPGNTGVVSRFPISSSEGPSDGTFLKAALDVRGTRLVVWSVHLEYRWYGACLPRGYGAGAPSGLTSEFSWAKIPTGPIADLRTIAAVNRASGRPEVMQSIIEEAAAELANGSRALIGGDFNEPSGREWTAAMADRFGHNGVVYDWDTIATMEAAGWVDGYRSLYPDPVTHPGITWPANTAALPISELTGAPDRDVRDKIDHLLHLPGSGLMLISAALVGPTGTIQGTQRVNDVTQDVYQPVGVTWPSDHKGQVQRFRIV